MITFEEFRATKQRMKSKDAEDKYSLGIWPEHETEFVLIYNERVYISEVESSMKYHLVVGRNDFMSKNLDELEAKLYLYLCEDESDFENEIKIRNQFGIFEENWYY